MAIRAKDKKKNNVEIGAKTFHCWSESICLHDLESSLCTSYKMHHTFYQRDLFYTIGHRASAFKK